jgi:hypothetical protein
MAPPLFLEPGTIGGPSSDELPRWLSARIGPLAKFLTIANFVSNREREREREKL